VDEDKTLEPMEYQILRIGMEAALRSAKAQEDNLEEQRIFRKSLEPTMLRDHFAALAMQAIISRGHLDAEMNVTPYCKDAYTIADAMLAAREQ